MDSLKIRALESLVAERILALEAGEQGVVADSTLRTHIKSLEKLMVRDELYKREVAAKVRVDQKEVQEGMRRFARRVTVLMLGLQNRDAARSVSAALRAGGRIDSIVAHAPGSDTPTVDTVRVTFGLLERTQENAVYALNEDRLATGPLKTSDGGWVVLVLLDRETDPEYARRSIPQRTQTVMARIRRREELEQAKIYTARILNPLRAQVLPTIFGRVARTLFEILQADSLQANSPSGYRLDRVVDTAHSALRAVLDDMLVQFKGGGMTVGEVLESYRTSDFVIPVLRKKDFRQILNASIRELVEREFLALEGYRERLDQTDQVRHDVDTWSTYWLARALMWKLVADVTVSDDEVIAYLIEQKDIIGNDYEVNVREILSDSLRESLAIMEQVVAGSDMKLLAREHSVRREWATRDGESGFFPVGVHPEIGFRALDAPSGALIGPVKVPEGYSLFTLLSSRRMPGDTTFPFDSLKAVVRNELLTGRTQGRLNRFISDAASRYHVKFFYNRLAETDIPAINLVTRRFIGFGGSMLAAPTLYPLWEWVREAKGVEEVLP